MKMGRGVVGRFRRGTADLNSFSRDFFLSSSFPSLHSFCVESFFLSFISLHLFFSFLFFLFFSYLFLSFLFFSFLLYLFSFFLFSFLFFCFDFLYFFFFLIVSILLLFSLFFSFLFFFLGLNTTRARLAQGLNFIKNSLKNLSDLLEKRASPRTARARLGDLT